jgi:hypothetical protein
MIVRISNPSPQESLRISEADSAKRSSGSYEESDSISPLVNNTNESMDTEDIQIRESNIIRSHT